MKNAIDSFQGETAADIILRSGLTRAAESVGMTVRGARTRAEHALVVPGRRGASPIGQTSISSSLIDNDGILEWHVDLNEPGSLLAHHRPNTHVVQTYDFDRIAHNRVRDAITALDQLLTPRRGLQRWRGDCHFEPAELLRPTRGHRLLLLHGMFSNTTTAFRQLVQDEGMATWMKAAYHEVLGFDHPTLSISPILNAIDLRQQLGDARGPLDVICHSRGGLVARWWLDVVDSQRDKVRVAYVGSPLRGTTLATPQLVRASLNHMSNLAGALTLLAGPLTSTNPYLAAATGLVRVAASLTGAAMSMPAIDALVALLPGLYCMSRDAGHPEFQRLEDLPIRSRPSFYVSANYRPPRPLRARPCLKALFAVRRMASAVASHALFRGPNDLVVDTMSMVPVAVGGSGASVLHLDGSANVHHNSYFASSTVRRQLVDWLAK